MNAKLLTLLLLAGCDAAPTGQALYASTCTSCHNSDPSKPGSLGPELRGETYQVLWMKVREGRYPPGYAPKRQSSAMPTFNFDGEQVAELWEYLK